MEKEARIRQLLPLIDRIEDEKLKNGVLRVWVKLWEESDWEDPIDCYYSLAFTDFGVVQHTDFTMHMALAMATYYREKLGKPVNLDLLLAGAALHDASDLVENAPPKDRPRKTAIGQQLVHAVYGAFAALNAGLPLELVHLINTHTPQYSGVPKTIEGVFLRYADDVAVDAIGIGKGRLLHLNMADIKWNLGMQKP